MSNIPRQNPHHLTNPGKDHGPPRKDQSNPDSPPARRTKVMNPTGSKAGPTGSKSPDSTETYNSSKTANPSMPWSEPEIDEVSPYGPGDGFVPDDQ